MDTAGIVQANDLEVVRQDYEALRHGAGVLVRDDCSVIQVTGRDRVSWFHKLATADVQALQEGRGTYGLLLNATGHVVADYSLLIVPDALVLYARQPAIEKLSTNLQRAIFREKVAVNEVSGVTGILSLQGPGAAAILRQILGHLPPLEDYSAASLSRDGSSILLVKNPRLANDGFDLFAAKEYVDVLRRQLISHGARPVGLAALNILRVEAGIPWYADDFDETMLAPEARLDPFIAENKGCYTGQEVIARIRNRGHVNRLLVRLEIQGSRVPARGDDVFVGDRRVGWITSAVWSFERGKPMALGYTRREVSGAGTPVEIERDGSRLPAVVIG